MPGRAPCAWFGGSGAGIAINECGATISSCPMPSPMRPRTGFASSTAISSSAAKASAGAIPPRPTKGPIDGRALLVLPPHATTLHWIACPEMTARQGAQAAKVMALEASVGAGSGLHAAVMPLGRARGAACRRGDQRKRDDALDRLVRGARHAQCQHRAGRADAAGAPTPASCAGRSPQRSGARRRFRLRFRGADRRPDHEPRAGHRHDRAGASTTSCARRWKRRRSICAAARSPPGRRGCSTQRA